MRTGGRQFIYNSLFLIAIELTAKLLGLFLFALLARFLGATEMGRYASAVALANFFVMVPKFGFDRLVQKEVGRDTSLFYVLFWEISGLKVLFSFATLGLLWLLLLVTGETHPSIVMLIACSVLLYSFLEFINALFRAAQRPELEVLVRALFSVVNLCLGTAVLYAGWGLMGFVIVQVFSSGAAGMLAFFIVERVAVKGTYSWNWRVLQKHVVEAAPFAGMLVALFFSHQISTLLLSALTGNEEVGYFAAGFRLFDILTLIPAAIMGAFLPRMSQLYITSVGAFVQTLRFTLKYLFILSAPITVGTAILARPLTVLFYGESFTPSTPVLQILAVVLIFDFWNFAGDSILVARNRERLLLRVTCLVATIHVSVNLLLIPSFSYLGACWTFLITQFLHFLILGVLLRRYLTAQLLLQLIAVPTLCVAVMGGVVFAIRDWHLWLVIPTGMAVYAIALLASGAVHKRDMEGMLKMRTAQLGPFPLEA